MKSFILATLFICSLQDQSQCDQKELMVEKAMCHLPLYEAKTPALGQWHDVTIRLHCKG